MSVLASSEILIASILSGSAAILLTLALWRTVFGERDSGDSFEASRREAVRNSSAAFRYFEPLVDETKHFFSGQSSVPLAQSLKIAPNMPPWQANEFMATKAIESAFVGVAIFSLVAIAGMPVFGFILGAVTGAIYPSLARSSVIKAAKRWQKRIRMRLPFAIDQISLMMEAGAGFEDSLRSVVADHPNHPLGIELAEVVRQTSLGRPRAQALSTFKDRMADDDVSEIVFAIVKGEELGTPISNILREQANQMRTKRSQWGEKAAAEAEVQMVFPGMITMVACLLVIVAPILLPVVVRLLES